MTGEVPIDDLDIVISDSATTRISIPIPRRGTRCCGWMTLVLSALPPRCDMVKATPSTTFLRADWGNSRYRNFRLPPWQSRDVFRRH